MEVTKRDFDIRCSMFNVRCSQLRTRRHFFRDCGIGVGKIALASLMLDQASSFQATAATLDPTNSKPHVTARAKRVIYLFMAGDFRRTHGRELHASTRA